MEILGLQIYKGTILQVPFGRLLNYVRTTIEIHVNANYTELYFC